MTSDNQLHPRGLTPAREIRGPFGSARLKPCPSTYTQTSCVRETSSRKDLQEGYRRRLSRGDSQTACVRGVFSGNTTPILCFALGCFLSLLVPAFSFAQVDGQDAMDSMPGMHMEASSFLPSFHASSGSSWQPASVPEHIWMTSHGGWDFMIHGTIFLTYNQQGGPRGEGKAESVNYAMFMEQHKLGRGTLLFREMLSAESLTSPHPGFPELFQTGETYHGAPLVDHQHPHNVFAELAALYTLPINKKVSWLLYGGPSAEPALGPVTYIHRESAAENPAAPLGHHWQDSTHTSFGVVTTGFIIDRFKLEASAFNGREPNEERWSIQPAALDSWSFRGTVAPTRDWTAQYSYGKLIRPEADEPGDQTRQTASIEYSRPLPKGNWATSLIWGRVQKTFENFPLNSYGLESTVNFLRSDYAYTRFELVDKDELFPNLVGHPTYRIGAYTFGGVRDLLHNRKGQIGLGADVTFYSKPTVLNSSYGTNPVSFHVFLRFRPGLMAHSH